MAWKKMKKEKRGGCGIFSVVSLGCPLTLGGGCDNFPPIANADSARTITILRAIFYSIELGKKKC